jgi:outer membrane protein TolC
VFSARRKPSSIAIASTLAVFAVSATAPPAVADPTPEPLSLRDAIARALKGNVDLRREGITLRTTEAGIVTALGQFDVVLGADGSVSRRVAPPVLSTDIQSGPVNTFNTDLLLTRPLETGGQLQLVLSPDAVQSHQRLQCGVPATMTLPTGQVVPVPFSYCNIYNPTVTLNFTQPLLRGFGREVTEATLRKARISRDQEVWNRAARAANVLRDTITAYWELAYQVGDLEIRRSAVALAEEQLRTTEAQVQIGKMGELQAAAVRRAISDDQQEVETSQQQLMARSLDLLRLLGTPVPARFAGLRTTDAVGTDPHAVDADDETARALKASPALKALEQGIALSDVDVRTAVASLKPQLDLSASIGRTGKNIDLSHSLRQLLDSQDTQGSVGLVFSLPMQNRAARGAEETARAARDNARLTSEDVELAIRDSAARLAAQVRSAGRRIDLAKESVKWAQQNLDAERARFQVGQSTNNDVLMRQQELKQAQVSGVRAAVDLLEADVALSALTGDILDTYGVTLRGY